MGSLVVLWDDFIRNRKHSVLWKYVNKYTPGVPSLTSQIKEAKSTQKKFCFALVEEEMVTDNFLQTSSL